MNLILKLLFPRLHQRLVSLRAVTGQPNNTMPRLSTEEEIQVIEGAITHIETQKQVIAGLREQLGSLPAENEELKAALAAADASDAASDEKLSELRGVIEQTEEPEA
ncbi:MAG: hypothetical protein ACKV19_10445 [Verrucomicrobiales bacterium]